MEDGRIVDLYFERSEDAITETKNKYGKYCRKIAYDILYSEEDAEECENDTYLKAWNAIPPTRPARLRLFLAAITRNTALNRYISARADKRAAVTDSVIDELADCISDPDADVGYDGVAIKDLLDRFLEFLPRTARIVFMRRYWYMNGIAEISKQCGMSESSVKVTLMRTRIKLKAYLEKEGIEV